MAVKIRLQRHGRKKSPFYHIVIADSRSPRDGRFIEKIGTYNPMTKPATIDIDRDAAYSWITKGAQPTDTVRAILRFKGVLYRKHLMRGVTKGALNEDQALTQYQAWIDTKEKKISDRFAKSAEEKKNFNAQVVGKPKAKKVVEEVPVVVEAVAEAPAVEAVAETVEVVAEAPAVEAVVETVEVVAEAPVVETVEVVAEAPAVEAVAETVEVVAEAPAVEAVAETVEVVAEAEAPAVEAVAETVVVEAVEETPAVEAIAETVVETPALEPINLGADDPEWQEGEDTKEA
jgi:small subunit ribosomal protein S16